MANESVSTNPSTQPSVSGYVPEKDLFTWKESSRPYKKRSREYWVTVFSIASLIAFILFLAEGVMPVILIIAVCFLYYVMSTVPPDQIEYKITSKGIKVADKLTPWEQIYRFWFDDRMGSKLLIFGIHVFPGKMEFVVSESDTEKLRDILQKYLPEEKPKSTSVDKAVGWVSQRLPQN